MEKDIKCPLCGHEFNEEDSEAACVSCPFNRDDCGNIKCPNCGYDFPLVKETKLEKWVKAKFKKSEKK